MLLNDGNTPVNVEDNDKATPLHTAAQAGQLEVIQKLVSKLILLANSIFDSNSRGSISCKRCAVA